MKSKAINFLVIFLTLMSGCKSGPPITENRTVIFGEASQGDEGRITVAQVKMKCTEPAPSSYTESVKNLLETNLRLQTVESLKLAAEFSRNMQSFTAHTPEGTDLKSILFYICEVSINRGFSDETTANLMGLAIMAWVELRLEASGSELREKIHDVFKPPRIIIDNISPIEEGFLLNFTIWNQNADIPVIISSIAIRSGRSFSDFDKIAGAPGQRVPLLPLELAMIMQPGIRTILDPNQVDKLEGFGSTSFSMKVMITEKERASSIPLPGEGLPCFLLISRYTAPSLDGEIVSDSYAFYLDTKDKEIKVQKLEPQKKCSLIRELVDF